MTWIYFSPPTVVRFPESDREERFKSESVSCRRSFFLHSFIPLFDAVAAVIVSPLYQIHRLRSRKARLLFSRDVLHWEKGETKLYFCPIRYRIRVVGLRFPSNVYLHRCISFIFTLFVFPRLVNSSGPKNNLLRRKKIFVRPEEKDLRECGTRSFYRIVYLFRDALSLLRLSPLCSVSLCSQRILIFYGILGICYRLQSVTTLSLSCVIFP